MRASGLRSCSQTDVKTPIRGGGAWWGKAGPSDCGAGSGMRQGAQTEAEAGGQEVVSEEQGPAQTRSRLRAMLGSAPGVRSSRAELTAESKNASRQYFKKARWRAMACQDLFSSLGFLAC